MIQIKEGISGGKGGKYPKSFKDVCHIKPEVQPMRKQAIKSYLMKGCAFLLNYNFLRLVTEKKSSVTNQRTPQRAQNVCKKRN